MSFNFKKFLYLIGFTDGYEEDVDTYDEHEDDGLIDAWIEPEEPQARSNVRRIAPPGEPQGAPAGHRQGAAAYREEPTQRRNDNSQMRQAAPAYVPPTGTVTVLPNAQNQNPSPAPTQGPRITDDVQVLVAENFNDAEEIAEHIRQSHPLLIDLRRMDHKAAQRTLDFVAGALFVTGSKLEPGVPKTYLLRPERVKLSNDARADLRSRGLLP